MPENEKWYFDGHCDLDKVHLVARYLVEEQGCDNDDILSLLEKPWHFAAEYEAAVKWQEAGN